MTTLATAAVQVVAETDGFPEQLRRKIHEAGSRADRAARDVGDGLGTTLSQGMARSLVRLTKTLHTSMVAVGRTARSSLSGAVNALGRMRDGFRDADAAASAFSGRMGSLGGLVRRSIDPGQAALAAMASALGRVRDGFLNADAAASAFSGRLGTLGGRIRSALIYQEADFVAISNALGRFRDGFRDANAAASAFSGALGTLGGQARQALNPALEATQRLVDSFGRLRDGFNDAGAAASVFSGRMGSLGGQARRALDPVVAITSRLGRSLRSLGASAASSLGALGAGAASPLGRMRDGFMNADAAASVFSGRLGSLGGQLRRVTDSVSRMHSEIGRDDFTTFNKVISRVGSGLSSVGKATGGVLRGMGRITKAFAGAAVSATLMLGVTASLMTMLPALGTLLGSTSTFLLGGGLATVGIVAAAQAEQVQTAFSDMASHVKDTFTGMAGPIEDSLVSLAKDLSGLTDTLAPSFEIGFADMGPALTRFFSEVTGPRGLGSWGPMIEAVSASFADMLDVVGPALAGSLSRLGDAITRMVEAADPQSFAGFLAGTIDLISGLFDLFTRARLARDEIQKGMAPALEALGPLAAGISAGFSTAAAGIGEFHRKYLSAMVDAIVAAAPLLEAFGAGFETAGDFIASFLDDISPALGAIEPFIAGFTEGFLAARGVIADVFGVLLDWLGPTEGGLRGLAEWLGKNETLMSTLGYAVGGIVAAFTTYRLVALGVALANTLVSRSFTAIAVGIRSLPVIGWIITAITLLALAIQQLWQRSERFRDIVTGAWSKVTSVFEGAGERIGQVLTAFREGWDNLTSAFQSDGGLAKVWEGLQDAVATTWGVVEPIFDQLGKSFNFLLGLISGDKSLSDAGELVGSYFDNLGDIGSNIAGFLIRQLQRLPSVILDSLAWFSGTLGPWLYEQFKALPGHALAGLKTLGTTISDWFSALPERIETALGVTDGWGEWFSDLAEVARDRLQGLAETIVDYVQKIPDLVKDQIGTGVEIVEWLQDLGPKILDFMRDYGPQILKGFTIAIGVVVLALPTLLLGLMATIAYVLAVITVELATWAWEAFTGMLETAGQALSQGLSNIVLWFQMLPTRILNSLADFGAQLYTWGTNALTTLRTAFSQQLGNLTSSWTTTWTTLKTRASDMLTSLVSWAGTKAGQLRDDIMGPVNTLKDRMITAFKLARDGIGEAWRGLRKTVATPIEWVVNTAYNEWLRGVWDKVVTKFGGEAGKLPSYTVAFAKGGIFPGNGGGVFNGYTPGRDVHAMPMAAFSGGESVLRPEVTRAWGTKTTLMLNKLARTGGVGAVRKALGMLFSGQNPFTGMSVPRTNPAAASAGGGFTQRFANGGILGAVTGHMSGVAKWLNSSTEDFSDGMLDFMDAPDKVLKQLLDQIMDFTKMPGWGSDWTKLLSNIPKKIIEMMAKSAKDQFSIDAEGDWINLGGSVGGRLGAALAFAKAQAGKPYVWGGVGPRGYDCSGFMSAIHNVIAGKRPYSRRYTTHGFVGNSANGFRRNMPSPFTIGNTHASVGHMAGTLLKTNVESRGSSGVVVGPRARGTTNALFSSRWGLVTGGAGKRSSRMGGEGLLYDSGGTLWPGTHLISNKTGKPESIRTYAQEERVARLVRAVEHQTAQVARSPLVPVDQIGELERALGVRRGEKPRVEERERVYAPITVNTQVADPAQVARKVVDRLVTTAGV